MDLRDKALNQSRYILSLKNKAFVWLPAKTASHTLSWILPHFDFEQYFVLNDNYIQTDEFFSHLGHSTNLPPNHESFLFLCSIRNPYDSIFSFFKMTMGKKTEFFNKETFSKFFENELKVTSSKFYEHQKMFGDRKPDYVIRTEKIYEDLIKIPFIRESNLNNCGILQEMCEKKMNKTFDFDNRNFYNDYQIKKINEFYSSIFELGNYEKW